MKKNPVHTLAANLLIALSLSAAFAGAEQPLSGVPRASDVVMRSLYPRPATEKDNPGTLDAADCFFITRLEWCYWNFEKSGSDAPAVIAGLKSRGIMTGGSCSGNSLLLAGCAGVPQEEFCTLDLDGKMLTPQHKQGWGNLSGQGSVFSPVYFNAQQAYYKKQLDLGVEVLQRDETRMGTVQAMDFSMPAIEQFREYLPKKLTSSELKLAGIDSIETFDVRRYFISQGAPNQPGAVFKRWLSRHPVGKIYAQFLTDGTVDFFKRMRTDIDAYAGRRVPFSCNNTTLQQWSDTELEFDWAMGELSLKTAEPVHMYNRAQAAKGLGKMQVFCTPMTQGTEAAEDQLIQLNRSVISYAYAIGMIGAVPWDVYMESKDGRQRYFGRPEDYADLFGFIRGISSYLEGFEENAAAGAGLNRPANTGLTVKGDGRPYAFIRSRPGDPSAPIIIHVVSWEGAGPVQISINQRLLPAGEYKADILTPQEYDPAIHQKVREAAAAKRPGINRHPAGHSVLFSPLVKETPSITEKPADNIYTLTIERPAPWAVILLLPEK